MSYLCVCVFFYGGEVSKHIFSSSIFLGGLEGELQKEEGKKRMGPKNWGRQGVGGWTNPFCSKRAAYMFGLEETDNTQTSRHVNLQTE